MKVIRLKALYVRETKMHRITYFFTQQSKKYDPADNVRPTNAHSMPF